jgi:hypothetical protein
MAIAPYSKRLNLTRDQFATFLKDHEAIKQFELLFTTVDSTTPNEIEVTTILAGNAEQKAVQAIDMVEDLSQETSVSIASAENKANQALALLAQLATAVDGLQMVPPPREFKRARYGQFFDTTTQVATVINTATTVTFNTTDISNGIFIGSPTSRIVVDTEGIYNFQVSMQFDSTGGSNHDVWVWFRKNGTDIPNSAMYLNIQNNQSEVLQAFNLLVSMKALDYLEVMWEVGNLNAQMAAFAATGVHPAIPSIILTATNNVQGVQ